MWFRGGNRTEPLVSAAWLPDRVQQRVPALVSCRSLPVWSLVSFSLSFSCRDRETEVNPLPGDASLTGSIRVLAASDCL